MMGTIGKVLGAAFYVCAIVFFLLVLVSGFIYSAC